MKQQLLCGIFLLAGVFSGQNTGKLTVKVTDLRNSKGHVLVTVFRTEDGFPMKVEKAVMKGKASISGNVAEISFTGLEAGVYAVAILHDEDSNGEVATNWFGIPKEGVAASNNAKGSFGPPDFEDAKFNLESADVVQVIKMEYL